jgi:hypothetical protein
VVLPTEGAKGEIQKAKRSQPSLDEGGLKVTLSLKIKHNAQQIASEILVSRNIAEIHSRHNHPLMVTPLADPAVGGQVTCFAPQL